MCFSQSGELRCRQPAFARCSLERWRAFPVHPHMPWHACGYSRVDKLVSLLQAAKILSRELHAAMADCMRPSPHSPYVDGPLIARCLQCFDQIACFHMSGLLVRSPMNAGQDGFREESSKRLSDLIGGHWGMRKFSRLGSIDHAICSLSCKFWHRLSTVAVELLPCLADLYQTSLKRYPTP